MSPPVAFVNCAGDSAADLKGCGTQGLDAEQYARQLANPWATWRCPCCGGEAQFDDERSEAALDRAAGEGFDDWPAPISL